MEIQKICNELNAQANNYKIGQLQRLRQKVKGLSKPKTLKLFSGQTINDRRAFHSGGRTELQFNIGIEHGDFRYGVAFSLQLSQTLPDISQFESKIQRFNEFLKVNYNELKHFDMWVYTRENGRTENFKITEIDSQYFKEGNFIFVGLMCPQENIEIGKILETFDQLLSLYEYVESNISLNESISDTSDALKFISGFSNKKSSTAGSIKATSFEIDLKHNDLQSKLCSLLSDTYGYNNVGDECITKFGTRVDAVVQAPEGYLFYEIKTASTIKLCIREALGQLLEYGYWDTETPPQKIVVVSDHEITDDANNYLRLLRREFNLPIYYQRVTFDDVSLEKMY